MVAKTHRASRRRRWIIYFRTQELKHSKLTPAQQLRLLKDVFGCLPKENA
jgi:hypothetical protein